ncbi:MAG: 4Fe-4S dicluster domain-containing protein, partial [Gammaproteobacteria bacterium]|nr:4Fe-4S dicluster domain-containing protein [Gammaproteobacteria bacterium]
GQMIKQSKSACCQCFRCSDLCPRNLIGHNIYPHQTMRTVDYNQSEPAEHITSAFLCSQCGVCELLACDFMLLSPRKIYAAYRQELVKKGVKNPHQRKEIKARPEFQHRKLSIPLVMKKLALTKYDFKLAYIGAQKIKQVRIPLAKHIGAPALPTVNMGQAVRMCDIIAKTPADKLGATYHASIAGKITDISENWIEITGI